VPRWIARVRHRPLRFAVHAGLTTVVAMATGFVIRPLEAAAGNYDIPVFGVLFSNVIITWAFVLPALLVQELRARVEMVTAFKAALGV